MVKNTHGGSGHKKFARKFTSSSKSTKLRIVENECERYAIATKMLGNNMFNCYCIDNVVRLVHIRGKFSGRGKRDNFVEIGKWVLVGLREWDVPSEKVSSISKGKNTIPECDLLEVYNDMDKLRLKESVLENWINLENHDESKSYLHKDIDNDDKLFCSDRDLERLKLIEEMKSSTTEKISLNIDNDLNTIEEEINFDDI